MKEQRWSPVRTLLLVVAAVPFIYPFVFVAETAFRTQQDYYMSPAGFPHHWTLYHLRNAWTAAGLGHAMINSAIAVSVGVTATVFLSSSAAFWFMRHSGRFARALFASIPGLWILPFLIWLIPFFVFLSDLGLTGNLYVLGMVYATTTAPFGVYLMRSYYKSAIPLEVLESAQVDGASALQQFLRIVLPLSKPALGTLTALSFIWSWGDLLLGLVLLNDPSKFPVTVAAAGLVQQLNANTQQTAAAGLIATVPMIAVFLFAQRAIVRGVTAGVGK
jgi:ABC-type glycerol-3-phosphate transport system permease component